MQCNIFRFIIHSVRNQFTVAYVGDVVHQRLHWQAPGKIAESDYVKSIQHFGRQSWFLHQVKYRKYELYFLMCIGWSWYLFPWGISVVTIVTNLLRIIRLSKHSLCSWRFAVTYSADVCLSNDADTTQCSRKQAKFWDFLTSMI